MILDIELDYDLPVADHCGSCTACIDACPTEALIAPYQIDGSKCISYATIELKMQSQNILMEKWMDGCLDATYAKQCVRGIVFLPTQEPAFQPNDEFLSLKKKDWEELTEDTFKRVFKKSAVKRTSTMD